MPDSMEFWNPSTRPGATLVGGSAVVLWGMLALFTTQTGQVPPFQLTAMTFVVAALLGVGKWTLRLENPLPYLIQPAPVWLLGVAGLFGYHFFYFMALRNAPPVEAGLIAYLWPLLIVMFSALLPGGGRLRWFHLVGAVCGLLGTVLLVTQGGAIAFGGEFALGYGFALAGALTWSTYSVLSRRYAQVPTDTVAAFCVVTAILALTCHLLFEQTLWPQGPGQWLAVLGLGLGPVGLAFYTWDHAVKHGDLRVLGALSYAAPLISTLLLIGFGLGQASWFVLLAMVLIVGGAALAAQEMLHRIV